MKILLDECLPMRLARLFPGHAVRSVRQMNWLGLGNEKLLAAADPEFDLFLTVDKNLVRQQKLHGLRMAVIVFHARSNKIEDLSPLVTQALAALLEIEPGEVVHIVP